ncbi:putative glutamine amidotransferase [Desulfonispora thiosulfatigenes DSM 11270]|uniref:Putative glutamine amidotransferase n=1 Tax=Desulfonispora thiosulfatigenes DSM 11270 TaxID=656914 RepID=A0A1W1V894_DESTI|nr:gamma-glutamyl-gamma-aminobutyrate hydrolase family protein [Desulfonispora thiosulfatigenes]SMB89649.1 putative glutamine amidotransferase [Desulfonispora thiosulfatigenes DSM 11270]
MRPIIGITAGFKNQENKFYLSEYYINAIEHAGGTPIILPAVMTGLIPQIYDMVDGIIFSGGSDVDPSFFGQNPLRGLGEITPNRDQFELFLAKKAIGGNKPVLGICRGMQVISIAAGGTIYQDISEITRQEHRQKAPKWYPYHEIKIEQESKVYGIIGRNRIKVNSFHHQAVKEPGSLLKASAWAEDGLIEAVESISEDGNIIGVQWHPECYWDREKSSIVLFENLVQKASEYKE